MEETKHNYSNVLLTDDDYTTMYPDNLTAILTDDTMYYSLISNASYAAQSLENGTSFLNDTLPENYEFVGSQEFYIVMYTVFIVAAIILTPARSLLFYKIFMNASKGLHKKMFSNVLAAPMRFFDTNPSGTVTILKISQIIDLHQFVFNNQVSSFETIWWYKVWS